MGEDKAKTIRDREGKKGGKEEEWGKGG